MLTVISQAAMLLQYPLVLASALLLSGSPLQGSKNGAVKLFIGRFS